MHDSLDQASTLHDHDKLDQIEENDEVAQHRHHLKQYEECLTEIIGLDTCVGRQLDSLSLAIRHDVIR